MSDPPYGCANNCDYTRFPNGKKYRPIVGDRRPFDPAPLLEFPKVCLWGYQFFASRLPRGTILVWNKKRPSMLGSMRSDCELAWVKGGIGAYLFNHVWNGCDRETERGQHLHPTQKPVALFRWVLSRMKLQPGDWILDPYCGTAPCGVACMELGLNYYGIEIDEEYAAIARKRVRAAQIRAA